MKYSIILSFLFAAVFITGCRKDDNPKVPDFTKVPIPLLTLDSTSDTKISGLEPEAFVAKFTVDVYFKNGELPKQLDLVVVKNGDAANAFRERAWSYCINAAAALYIVSIDNGANIIIALL